MDQGSLKFRDPPASASFFFFFFFLDRVSLCSPGCSVTCSVDQADLKFLRDPPATMPVRLDMRIARKRSLIPSN